MKTPKYPIDSYFAVSGLVLETIEELFTNGVIPSTLHRRPSVEQLFYSSTLVAHERWLKANDELHLIDDKQKWATFQELADKFSDDAIMLINDLLRALTPGKPKDELH